ncbi:MAG: hypothetical protein HRU19_30715 [Pseudobacteriovorax sp.]|nr:hypothetical protein [Pseudobacteriovorax sp.]
MIRNILSLLFIMNLVSCGRLDQDNTSKLKDHYIPETDNSSLVVFEDSNLLYIADCENRLTYSDPKQCRQISNILANTIGISKSKYLDKIYELLDLSGVEQELTELKKTLNLSLEKRRLLDEEKEDIFVSKTKIAENEKEALSIKQILPDRYDQLRFLTEALNRLEVGAPQAQIDRLEKQVLEETLNIKELNENLAALKEWLAMAKINRARYEDIIDLLWEIDKTNNLTRESIEDANGKIKFKADIKASLEKDDFLILPFTDIEREKIVTIFKDSHRGPTKDYGPMSIHKILKGNNFENVFKIRVEENTLFNNLIVNIKINTSDDFDDYSIRLTSPNGISVDLQLADNGSEILRSRGNRQVKFGDHDDANIDLSIFSGLSVQGVWKVSFIDDDADQYALEFLSLSFNTLAI